MKKSKLLLSTLSLCFALTVLCFGVYAANQVNYSISGNISYSVTDAYVDVTTSIYAMKDTMSRLDVRNALDDMCGDRSTTNNITEITSHPQKYEFVKSESWSSVNSNSNTYNFGNLNIAGSHGYFFVFSVKKASSDTQNVWVAMGDNVTESANTFIYDNMFTYNIGLTPKTFVVGVGIADPTQSINPAESISFDLEFGTGTTIDSIANSDWMQDKLSFNGSAVSSALDENEDLDTSIAGLVVIPSSHNSISITNVAESGFENCGYVREVYLPSSITTLNNHAFLYTSVNNINIHSTLSLLGISCFGMMRLVKLDLSSTQITKVPYSFLNYAEDGEYLGYDVEDYSIYLRLPNSVTEIGGDAFNTIKINNDNFTLPTSLITIGHFAFCSSELNSINLSTSVTYIGNGAFDSCNLSTVRLPSSLSYIGDMAFTNTMWFDNLTYNVNHLAIVDSYDNPANVKFLLKADRNNIGTSVTISKEIKYIFGSAFTGCNNLESVIFEENSTLVGIGSYAFNLCGQLSTLTIPESVVVIDDYAFGGCTKLTSIQVPETVTTLGREVFRYWNNTQTVNVHWNGGSKPVGWDINWRMSCNANVVDLDAA